MKKYISVLLFILFLFLGNFIQKAEAWGYMTQLGSSGIWTDYGTETDCRAKLMYDTAAITSCVEKNPTSNYIFTNVVGPINTTNNKIVGNSYTTAALCETARATYLKTTPGASNCYQYSTATYYVDPGVINLDTKKDNTTATSKGSAVYKLLAPIGGLITAPTNIGDYFNILFRIAIGICAVLAVVMIVLGGIQYMGDESIFGKTEAKGQITKAILGLLIALGAYALLNTINPAMLGKNGVNISAVSAEIEGDSDAPIGGINSLPSGIVCSGGKTNIPNIVNSFSGKMTYQMGAKGVAGPNNTIKLDCSGFVNYVLKCANVSFTNGGTASIFNGAEKVTSIQSTKVNSKELGIGDLVGWRAGENSEKYGHVMIYVGNGQVQVADSHGGSTTGNALGVFPITKYQDRIKYIKRAL